MDQIKVQFINLFFFFFLLFFLWNMCDSHLDQESKTVLDSRFQVLNSRLCQWNLDAGFQWLVGFRIPWAVFRILNPRTLHSTSQTFLPSRIRIPFPDMTHLQFSSFTLPLRYVLENFIYNSPQECPYYFNWTHCNAFTSIIWTNSYVVKS